MEFPENENLNIHGKFRKFLFFKENFDVIEFLNFFENPFLTKLSMKTNLHKMIC